MYYNNVQVFTVSILSTLYSSDRLDLKEIPVNSNWKNYCFLDSEDVNTLIVTFFPNRNKRTMLQMLKQVTYLKICQ